jgi:hypothetical protein
MGSGTESGDRQVGPHSRIISELKTLPNENSSKILLDVEKKIQENSWREKV